MRRGRSGVGLISLFFLCTATHFNIHERILSSVCHPLTPLTKRRLYDVKRILVLADSERIRDVWRTGTDHCDWSKLDSLNL